MNIHILLVKLLNPHGGNPFLNLKSTLSLNIRVHFGQKGKKANNISLTEEGLDFQHCTCVLKIMKHF